ncbi:MAG: energy transducer TonB [Proteobacteria bacterium]|nr:energy transducer TonB [Pseudomonadota bacterium]
MSKLSMNKLSIFVIATLCAGSTLAAENVKKVSPQDLARYWLLESRTAQQANIPWRGKNLNAPTCAAVAYTIGNDGRTRDVTLEKIVPDGDLGKTAVDVVSHMRFAATAQNAQRLPVRTYVAMPFNLPDANSPSAADRARREQALAACKLGGYGNDNDVVIPVR